MSYTQISKEEIINTLQKEAMKEYYEYDGNNRVVRLWQAATDTPHGGACLYTQYSYVADSSNREKMKEAVVAWDSAWEL
jgi:hypothetical protein